jgi:threonine dehydratase
VLVPSFDDVDVIEGQGTAGLEILAQIGRVPARVVVPCGGGGLAAGIALALPDSTIVIVEPEGWDDMARGLAGGAIVEVPAGAPSTSCDALQTRRVAQAASQSARMRCAGRCARRSGSGWWSSRAVRWGWRPGSPANCRPSTATR